STVNKLLTTGTAIYKHAAAKNQFAGINPFALAERSKANTGEIEILIDMQKQDNAEKPVSPDEVLSTDEAASLIVAATPGFERTLYSLALSLGLRINEELRSHGRTSTSRT